MSFAALSNTGVQSVSLSHRSLLFFYYLDCLKIDFSTVKYQDTNGFFVYDKDIKVLKT